MTCQFWNLIKLFATPSTTPALVGGGLLGYVMYDVTHHYLHHGQPSGQMARNLKVSTEFAYAIRKILSSVLLYENTLYENTFLKIE